MPHRALSMGSAMILIRVLGVYRSGVIKVGLLEYRLGPSPVPSISSGSSVGDSLAGPHESGEYKRWYPIPATRQFTQQHLNSLFRCR